MATTQKTQADVEFNNGLERGRKHQERGGYPVPQRALDLPEAASRAYLAGWELGYSRTTPLSLLRR